MPLPPALLARLKRRGIVQEDEDEEVIAENYDGDASSQPSKAVRSGSDTNAAGAPYCPNKYNPYHYCVLFCYQHWNEGTFEDALSKKYTEQRLKILKKYPLPPGWKEVYDAGCARHYYWFPRSDEVSWLPPRHPLAVIGDAAPKVSREMFEKKENTNGLLAGTGKQKEKESRTVPDDRGRVSTYDDRRSSRRDDRRDERRDERRDDRRDDRSRRKRRRSHSRGSGSEDESSRSGDSDDQRRRPEPSEKDRLKRARRKGIDPMDPAAYGDHVPVGSWNTGLHAHDRTGADVTATGPLFQQRPYPAPGAVLRRQGKAHNNDDDD